MLGNSRRRQLWLTVVALCALTCGGILLSWSRNRTASRQVKLSEAADGLLPSGWFKQLPPVIDAWPPSPPLNLSSGADALVLVHIQKTGGSSLNRQFIRKSGGLHGLPCDCAPGRKRCRCATPAGADWLFSRSTTGWACGLHAGLGALEHCAPRWRRFQTGARLHYLTVLRRPVSRFLSEWSHVRRGATWRAARDFCNGRPVSPAAPCYEGDDWSEVSLAEFAACERNPARDRQSRMLATGAAACGRNGSGGEAMLASAVSNLHRLAFAGLTEYQVLNQYQLTRGLGLLFNKLFWQHEATVSGLLNLTEAELHLVKSVNRLDLRLYAAAEALFFRRIQRLLLGDALVDGSLKAAVSGLGPAELRSMSHRLEAAAVRVLRRLGAQDIGSNERRRVRQKVENKLAESELA